MQDIEMYIEILKDDSLSDSQLKKIIGHSCDSLKLVMSWAHSLREISEEASERLGDDGVCLANERRRTRIDE